MTLCRSRGEFGRARHRDDSFNAVFGARFSARLFSQAFAPATQFTGCSKVQAHCLALERSPLDHSDT
jgi:hypothetical protein